MLAAMGLLAGGLMLLSIPAAQAASLPGTIIAGTGVAGNSGDGGLASAAQLRSPDSVAEAPDGTVYVSDLQSSVLRKIAADGTISTVLSYTDNAYYPGAISVGPDGSVYMANFGEPTTGGYVNNLLKISGDGTVSVLVDGTAWGNDVPINNVFATTDGRIYMSVGQAVFGQSSGSAIYKVGSGGGLTLIAGNGTGGYSGDGGLATLAELNQPTGIALDSDGSLYFADQTGSFSSPPTEAVGALRKVSPAGIITTVAIGVYDIVDSNGTLLTECQSSSLSGYDSVCTVGNDGTVAMLYPGAGGTSRSEPLDVDISQDGQRLYIAESNVVRVAEAPGATSGPTPTPTPTPPTPQKYAALGDSFSSGEGNPPFLGTTPCHRSSSAYGPLLAAGSGGRLAAPTFVACSGAVTDNIINVDKTRTLVAQITRLPADARVVTLTIGGNDVLFGAALDHCVDGLRFVDIFATFHPGWGCSKNAPFVSIINSRLATLDGGPQPPVIVAGQMPVHALSEIYRAIHAKAQNARIYVAGYPVLFGGDLVPIHKNAITGIVDRTGCSVWSLAGHLPFTLDSKDIIWLNSEGNKLNAVIRHQVALAAAAGVPVQYVSPGLFSGHAICDFNPQYFNRLILNGVAPDPGSFHPNHDGQSLGYLPAFRAATGY